MNNKTILICFCLLLFIAKTYTQGIFRVSPKGFNKSGAYEFNPKLFTRMGDKLYFFATDKEDGLPVNQLWVTDGSWKNTKIIKQINDKNYSTLHDMGSIASAVLFFDDMDTSLWRSDGTETGTYKIKKIRGKGFYYYNGKLFFEGQDNTTGYRQIWITDGTDAGTFKLADCGTSNQYTGMTGPKIMFKNKLYMAISPSFMENQLWESDGTVAGTKMVKDINPTGRDDIDYFTIANDILYFKCYYTGGNGANYLASLWKTDGTAGGTQEVFKLPYPNSFFANNLVNVNNKLYFLVNGDFWTSDGSNSGTQKLNLDTTDGGSLLAYPADLIAFNNEIIFRTSHTILGYQMGKLNLANNKISLITSTIKNLNPTSIKKFNNGFIFVGICDPTVNSNASYQLWYSNGTDTGTKMVLPPSFSNNKGISFLNFSNGDYNFYNNEMYFRANYDHILGYQMFKFTLDSVSKPEINLTSKSTQYQHFSLFPNPTAGSFTIQSENPLGKITVFNSIGKTVFQTQTPEKQLQITLKQSGIYFVQLQNTNSRRIEKLIIQ